MNDPRRFEVDDGSADGLEGEGKRSKTLLSRSLSKVSAVTYNAKKTVAQGMMDIALLTANANQLRYIVEFRDNKTTNFMILLALIACSLILQVNTCNMHFSAHYKYIYIFFF